jgi:thiosulfate/3-mercaptopyruvate sulfurtransferase
MFRFLISVDELVGIYQSPNVVVIDCRFSLADDTEGERLYRQTHIPGAYYLHLNRDLSGVVGEHGGRHPLPDTPSLISKLEGLGVSHNTQVVIYDDSRLAFASRLWWWLRYVGHENVKILNGGFRAWCDRQCPISSEVPSSEVPVRGDKMGGDIRANSVVDINTVKTVPNTEGSVLVDSRERERFLGIKEPIDPVAGHINGAVNYPWQEVTDEKGFFLDLNQQRRRWQALTAADELVVYCGSGVSACVNLLSLAELGRDDAKLYVGSWSDWCSYLDLCE